MFIGLCVSSLWYVFCHRFPSLCVWWCLVVVVDLVVDGVGGAGLSKFAVFCWLVSPLNVH